jgi:hypothetical protein
MVAPTLIGTRVRVSGQPVMVQADEAPIAGCGAPNPCVRAVVMTGAVRARASSQPLIHAGSVVQCFAANGVINGPAIMTGTDPRVSAS